MSTLDLCEKYFATRDVYKLMGLTKDSNEKDIKKAYHKLSLLVHPDRVSEAQKEESTEKFKVLSRIYQILMDPQKRALFDEQGIIDDDDEDNSINWRDFWCKCFGRITEEDIRNYEKKYVGSESERADIKKAYLGGKGCINYMMHHVPFMKVEDEPRIREVVAGMIASNEVPEYKIFTEEPTAKRNKRHKKYAREAKELEKLTERRQKRREKDAKAEPDGSGSGSLQQLFLARKNQRESDYDSLMDCLMEKYGGEDESDTVDFSAIDKKKKKKLKSKVASKQKQKSSKINGVKNGRVEKRKA